MPVFQVRHFFENLIREKEKIKSKMESEQNKSKGRRIKKK
jgi:hypothetical protein